MGAAFFREEDLVKILMVIIFGALLNLPSYAVDYAVTVKRVSKSGKTVLLNKGFNDQIDAKDYGILLVEAQLLDKNNRPYRKVYKPVAKLKAAQVSSNSSIWVAYKVLYPEVLVPKASLLLLNESSLMQGRRELTIDRETVIDRPDLISKSLKRNLVDNGEELIEKKSKYGSRGELHGKQRFQDSDARLVDLEIWEETVPGVMRYEGFYKSPYAEEFSERLRVQRFEKMVAIFMKKRNDPRFTMERLYKEQERDPNSPKFKRSSLGGNLYESVQGQSYLDETHKAQMADDFLSKGENWSAGYSDEELSELLYNVGALREKERRAKIGAQQFDYQGYGAFGLNLLNNENLGDRENSEQSKYDIELALEWFVFKHIDVLKKFSLEGSLRRAKDAATTGDYNALTTEYSAGFQLNFYPFNPPNTIEANIVYFGALFRYGWARMEIPSLGEKGNYSVVSFPGIKGGVKYNFSNGYGVRLTGGLENIISGRIIRTVDEGELPDRISRLEGKLSIGLSRFF